MTASEDEDESLANFLESEILACLSSSDQEEEEEANTGRSSKKKQRLNEIDNDNECSSSSNQVWGKNQNNVAPKQIETGFFGKVPPELFHHILKYLSSEDLIACSLVCKFLNYAASDECLWRRLYCLRWGLASPTKKLRESAWKQLYIQRDQEDMVEFVRNTPSEFKEYYIQMQAAKRSQAPLLSQVNDDSIILDRTVADQVSMWKASKGLTDDVVVDHACSGDTCSYYQIGDVFLCEKTGRVHVCGDTCRDVIADASNGLLICTISGHCFESMLSPTEPDPDDEQGGVTDDAEPFMGSGRFARAYLLGYNCADEKELQSALRTYLVLAPLVHYIFKCESCLYLLLMLMVLSQIFMGFCGLFDITIQMILLWRTEACVFSCFWIWLLKRKGTYLVVVCYLFLYFSGCCMELAIYISLD